MMGGKKHTRHTPRRLCCKVSVSPSAKLRQVLSLIDPESATQLIKKAGPEGVYLRLTAAETLFGYHLIPTPL